MDREPIEFLSAVLLVSKDPQRLADFYRDVIGVPLQEERHGDSLPHWGCTLGEFTQLSDEWFKHLETRRGHGDDIVTRWRKVKGASG
jgi:hypothetical protein